MARVTIFLRNGKEFDFETASITNIQTKLDGAGLRVTGFDAPKKDNGLSLMFVDYSEIIAITRDTRKDD